MYKPVSFLSRSTQLSKCVSLGLPFSSQCNTTITIPHTQAIRKRQMLIFFWRPLTWAHHTIAPCGRKPNRSEDTISSTRPVYKTAVVCALPPIPVTQWPRVTDLYILRHFFLLLVFWGWVESGRYPVVVFVSFRLNDTIYYNSVHCIFTVRRLRRPVTSLILCLPPPPPPPPPPWHCTIWVGERVVVSVHYIIYRCTHPATREIDKASEITPRSLGQSYSPRYLCKTISALLSYHKFMRYFVWEEVLLDCSFSIINTEHGFTTPTIIVQNRFIWSWLTRFLQCCRSTFSIYVPRF